MKRFITAVCCIGLITLNSCTTTPTTIIEQQGDPDFVYEESGDMGMWYLYSDQDTVSWHWHRKELYYANQATVYIFSESNQVEKRPMTEVDFNRLLQLKEQRPE